MAGINESLTINSNSSKLLTLPNGKKMPLVGLGMWQSDNPAELENAVDAALEAGYRHFDTATLYKNEAELGKALKKWLDSGRIRRDELFITTKLPWNAMAPELVGRFLDSSIKRLQTHIDLYLLHWPIGVQFRSEEDLIPMDDQGNVLYDTKTNLEAIWKEMEKQVENGKVKSIGISNFNEKQIERIMKVAKIPPANHQIEIHAYFQNRKLREFSEKHGITLCAYGPLGSPGRNPDSFTAMKFTVPNLLQDPVILDIATKHRKTAGQVLLRFLVQQNVVVIPKSTNPQRIQQNISIFDFELTNVDMRRIEALDKGEAGRSFPGFTDMKKHPECPWFV